jgi:hypothetical protein
MERWLEKILPCLDLKDVLLGLACVSSTRLSAAQATYLTCRWSSQTLTGAVAALTGLALRDATYVSEPTSGRVYMLGGMKDSYTPVSSLLIINIRSATSACEVLLVLLADHVFGQEPRVQRDCHWRFFSKFDL